MNQEKLLYPKDGEIPGPPSSTSTKPSTEAGAYAAFFRPSKTILLPTSDIKMGVERRNKAAYGFTVVTSVAHVWFNAFFESQFSSTDPSTLDLDRIPASINPQADSGVFSVEWESMDGIRGSTQKGTRALDRVSVVWRAVSQSKAAGLANVITVPQAGEPVPETGPADRSKENQDSPSISGKDLGLRTESPPRGLSKANSVESGSNIPAKEQADEGDDERVKACGQSGEAYVPFLQPQVIPDTSPPSSIVVPDHIFSSGANNGAQLKPEVDLGMEKVASPGPMQVVGLNKDANAWNGANERDLDDGGI